MSSGGYIGTIEWFPWLGTAANVPRQNPIYAEYGAADQAGIEGGVFTNTQPIDIRSIPKTGGMIASFFDDYYNSIHLIPTHIDFGNIANSSSQSMTVWNAHLDNVELESVTNVGGEGIDLNGPAIPVSIRPLGRIAFTVTATLDGPPQLDALYTFNFDTDEFPSLSIVGVRAKVLAVEVNWSSSYTVTYSYSTEVIVSESGKEQRRSLRSSPRKSIEFSSIFANAAFRTFERNMISWQGNVFVLPEMTRNAVVATDEDAGTDTVTVQIVPPWMVVGALVIMRTKGQQEIRTIESVDGLKVTFKATSPLAWPTGSLIYAAVSGRVAASLEGANAVRDAVVVPMHFDVTPGSESDDPPAASETFNGRELFTRKPNWGSNIGTTYAFNAEVIDFDRNKLAVFKPIAFGTRTRSAVFLAKNYDEALEYENFFRRMKGQRGEFYMATGSNDLVMKRASPLGSNTIRIDGVDTATDFAADTVYRAVAIIMLDGTRYNRVVDSIAVVNDAEGDDTVIQFSETFPEEIDPDDVLMISWMPVWRHAADELTFEWLTSGAAQIAMTLMTLEDLTAE